MNDFITRLTKYGADVPSALERFLDDAELYESCTATFMQDASFAALGQAIASANYEAAFEAAHTLKGVAANLSLTPLLRAISELVEALRAQNYTKLDEQYQAVLIQQNIILALL